MRSPRVTPDARIDITAEVCPMTFVRTKIALERLPVGGVLEVRLKGDEPLRNVPESARDLGHTVLGLDRLEDGTWRLLLRREAAGC
ncbi:MAG: sulfurtransferase TusA family protein [Myxococcaceae bacterium]|nr:MAG: sulfurtransferase TusA family protein [Myxococcaceae bacterium]